MHGVITQLYYDSTMDENHTIKPVVFCGRIKLCVWLSYIYILSYLCKYALTVSLSDMMGSLRMANLRAWEFLQDTTKWFMKENLGMEKLVEKVN